MLCIVSNTMCLSRLSFEFNLKIKLDCFTGLVKALFLVWNDFVIHVESERDWKEFEEQTMQNYHLINYTSQTLTRRRPHSYAQTHTN